MIRKLLPETGDRIAGFTLEERIGEGGMGVVYRGRHGDARPVAIKILRSEKAAIEDEVQAFRDEAYATAAVDHEAVVSLIECGVEEDVHYLVMEYVDGPPLDRYLRAQGRLPGEAAISIVLQVARALEHAHRLGFVHLDVKPGNILLYRDGRARLTDFGIVKDIGSLKGFLIAGRKIGTPAYASPEQCRGLRVGPASDIYSLGVTLFHLVCGRPPFTGRGAREIAIKQVKLPPPVAREIAPEVPRPLSNLLRRMLAKSPLERPKDMRAVIEALRVIRDGRVVISPTSSRRAARLRASRRAPA